MPRIRSIRPEIWESHKFGKLRASVRLLFIGLITLADDVGVGRAESVFLFGRLHPYAPDITIESFKDDMRSLQKSGLARFYFAKDSLYYLLPGFTEHQQINRPSKWRNPGEEEATSHGLSEPSVSTHCGKGREGKGKEGKGKEGRGPGRGAPRLRPASRPSDSLGMSRSGSSHGGKSAARGPKAPPGGSQAQKPSAAAERPQSKRRSEPKAPAVPEGSAYRLSAFLRNLILANDPKARVPKESSKAFATWKREAGLIFRRDGRGVEETVALLRWALDNEFWRANILSITKFRKQYTQLLLNRRADKAAEERKHPACPICMIGKPLEGGDLCENCRRCSICSRAPQKGHTMRFVLEKRRDNTRRAICRPCAGKKSKESGHAGLTAVKEAMKEAIS